MQARKPNFLINQLIVRFEKYTCNNSIKMEHLKTYNLHKRFEMHPCKPGLKWAHAFHSCFASSVMFVF